MCIRDSNIPVSLVSELHNYNTRSASSKQLIIPLVWTNLRRFCASVIGRFFWNSIPQLIRNKPSKKIYSKSTFTLVPCSILMKHHLLIIYWAILYFFSFTFLLKITVFLLYVTLRGTILVFLNVSCIFASLAMVLQIQLFLLRKTCEILRHLLPKYLNQRNLVPRASRSTSLFLAITCTVVVI